MAEDKQKFTSVGIAWFDVERESGRLKVLITTDTGEVELLFQAPAGAAKPDLNPVVRDRLSALTEALNRWNEAGKQVSWLATDVLAGGQQRQP